MSSSAAAARARLALPRLTEGGLLIPIVAALVLAFLTAVPLVMLVTGAFTVEGEGFGIRNLTDAYSNPRTYVLLANSFAYAIGTSLVALVAGTALAWIVERTNTPLRRWFYALSLVPLIVPGIVSTIAWIFLLSGRIGVLNRAVMAVFGLSDAPFDIFSLPGMVWAEGLHLSPLVFLVMSAAFRSMDPSLEESAMTSGANTAATLRRVTLPVLVPALASAVLVMFVRGLESFEVPALLGIPAQVPVFTSEIYLALRTYPQDYGRAGALALGLLAVSALGVWWYQRLTRRAERFATITGKAYRPRPLDLGRWRYATLATLVLYFVVIVGLPFAVLLFVSALPYYIPSFDMLSRLTLDNYAFILEHPMTQQAVRNSFFLAVGAATATMALTAVIAWIVHRTRIPGRGLLDLLAFLPIGIPGLVLAVAIIFQYIAFPLPIYGTVWLLVIAYVTKYLPYGMRTNSAAMLQIHRELEEAASAAGATWWTRFRRIVLPLLRPGLVAGWLYILVVSIRELSASVLLVTSDNTVLSFLIFDLQQSGKSGAVAALSVMLVLGLVAVVAIVNRLGGLIGVREG